MAMRKRRVFPAVLLACLVAMSGVSGAHAQGSGDRIESPGVRVGDTWIYNKIDGWNKTLQDVSVNAVKRSDQSGILMESSSLDGSSVAKVLRSAAFNLVRIDGPGFTQTAEPSYPNYSFPLYAGKAWSGKVVLSNTKQAGRVAAEFQGKVVGWEMVTVPAGTFLALKLSMKGTYVVNGPDWPPPRGTIEDTLWYAPEVRNAVRYEYVDFIGGTQRYNHEVHELVRFWPGN